MLALLTRFDCGHALPDALDHTSSLMAQNAREKPLSVSPTESVVVCVAHTTGEDLPGGKGLGAEGRLEACTRAVERG